jgi:pyroglutamyl-peptidase
MKKLLITGFDPFGGQSVNPAREAVMRLPDAIGKWELTKIEIPTVFDLAAQTVLHKAKQLEPDAILCVGQAGGRAAVTPEVYGVNLRHARIADNEGFMPRCVPIVSGAQASYRATLPVQEMVSAVRKIGLPCAFSYSAGRFVCNDLLYSLLHQYRETDIQVGFVHIPYLPEQAGQGVASLALEDSVRALYAMILAM